MRGSEGTVSPTSLTFFSTQDELGCRALVVLCFLTSSSSIACLLLPQFPQLPQSKKIRHNQCRSSNLLSKKESVSMWFAVSLSSWYLLSLCSVPLLFGDNNPDNNVNTGVSIPYCSQYLCPRFPKAVTAYFKSGCESNLHPYLLAGQALKSVSSVPFHSLIVALVISLFIGLLGGCLVARQLKNKHN